MRYFLSALVGILLALLGLEGVLRCLPVSSGIRLANSSAELPFSHYLPRQPYQYSFGWAMDNAMTGVTNGTGITNSRDYADHANALVIGDSYIEAFMLPYQDTVQGRLDATLGKVYAVGASSNGLADSLVIARHFIPRIHPKTIVMFVEPYDLVLIDQEAGRAHNHFVVKPDGIALEKTPYAEPASKRMLLHSALLRYAYYNLKVTEIKLRPGAAPATPPTADSGLQRKARRDAVLGYYLAQLQELRRAHGTQFVFLVDGDRNVIYSPKTRGNWQGDDRAVLLKALADHGFAAVDMQPVFERHWATYHERMDFLPFDGHWNKVGHRLAADALLGHLR